MWNVLDDPGRQIASVNTTGFEEMEAATSDLFRSEEEVAYSGIILSNDQALTTGQTVEKNCYRKGGFQFLFKSYDDGARIDTFPTDQLVTFLNRLGTSYLKDVEKMDGATAELDVAWAVCQREGDYGTMHNHIAADGNPDLRYSGMFYLSTPECINPATFPNGCLHIVVDNRAFYFPPVPGSVIIWPSWMMHGIHPFRGPGDRIGIAFDFNRTEVEQ